MSIKYRRIICLLAFLIFIIFTPIIITYAMGYRYNFKKNKFDKLGMLSITLKQDDINIYINDELYEKRVKKYPFIPKVFFSKIEHSKDIMISLLPGEYNLKLKKENYWQWENNLTINPNLTTFAPQIMLIKKSSPAKLLNGDFTQLSLGKKNNLYFIKKDGAATMLAVFSLNDEKIKNIYEWEAKDGFKYQLSVNNERILIKDGQKNLVIDPLMPQTAADIQEFTSLNKAANSVNYNGLAYDSAKNGEYLKNFAKGHDFYKIKWAADNDYILYALEKNSDIIYKIDIVEKKIIPYASAKCEDYIIHFNSLYILAKDELAKKTSVKLLNKGNEKEIAVLPYGEKIIFTGAEKNYLLAQDENSKTTYLIEPNSQTYSKIKATFNGAKSIKLSSKKNKILYANDFEIWVYDLEENKNCLITRLSSSINDVHWHKNDSCILFNTDSDINIIEYNFLSQRNLTTVLEWDNSDEIIFLNEEKEFLFTVKTDEQVGLYSLELY